MTESRFEKFADIIAFAIRREIDAAEGYRMMAGRAETPGLKALLLDLEREEVHHRELLENLPELPEAESAAAPAPDLGLSDSLGDEPLRPDMTFQDLLIFAAKKEQKAIDLYTTLARTVEPGARRELFEFLAGQEKVHKLRLESEYEAHVLTEN